MILFIDEIGNFLGVKLVFYLFLCFIDIELVILIIVVIFISIYLSKGKKF